MDNVAYKEKERTIITRTRAVAVFLIVLAHCNAAPPNTSQLTMKMIDLCSSISFFGVWMFFILGGYLLKYEKRTFLSMLSRRVKRIVVPWLFTGLLVYTYTNVRHGGISLMSLIQFIVGYGSYLWYMAVYIVLLVLFSAMRKIKWGSYLLVVLAVIMELSGIQYHYAGTDYKLYYFLVGAWPIAFGIGYLINQNNWGKSIFAHVEKYGGLWFAAAFIAAVAVFLGFGRWYYWSKCYLPLCVAVTPAVMGLVLVLGKVLGSVMDEIGRMSFSIYLLHMPMAGIVSNIMCRFDSGLTVPIRPFIVIALTWLGIRLIYFLAEKFNKTELVSTLIGGR